MLDRRPLFSGSGLQLSSYEEAGLPEDQEGEISALLKRTFPDYPDRSFYKQRPHRRWLVRERAQLIGLVAADFRHMRLGARGLRVTGLIDLCVAREFRNRGVGGALVDAVQAYAVMGRSDVIIAFADDHRLYRGRGFLSVANPVRLLRLDEDRSQDVATRPYPGELLIKPLTDTPWNEEAELDLLGYLY